jgi:hypothetical protein
VHPRDLAGQACQDRGSLIPIPHQSLAAAEVRPGADRAQATETESRVDGSPLVTTVAAAAAVAMPLQEATARAREGSLVTKSRPDELWTGEVDRLFTAALHELRRGAEQALAALEKCRTACCTVGARSTPTNGELYKALHRVTEAIDDIAVLLTGDRTHLWAKRHSTPEKRKGGLSFRAQQGHTKGIRFYGAPLLV